MKLRAPEPADLDAMYRWENDSEQWTSSSTVAPLSRQQLWDYIENYDGNIFAGGQLRMIIEVDGAAIGTIDITDFDARNRRGYVGIYVAPQYRDRGYGRQAIEMLCHYASEHLGMHQLAAITLVENKAACELFAACDFDSRGKLKSWVRRGREWLDAIIWQRLFTT